MDVMLRVEESNGESMPLHLESLVERMGKERLLINTKGEDEKIFLPVECELVFAFSLIVAIEEGFRIDDTLKTTGYDKRAFDALSSMPDYRAKAGVLLIELKHARVIDCKFFLSTSYLIESTLLTFFSEDQKGHCISSTATIEHNKYLKTSKKGAAIFHNSYTLSQIVKKPIYSIKQTILRGLNVCCPDIICLPEDVLRLIFKKLKASDFISLSLTTNKLCRYINDEDIWRFFLKRDFKCNKTSNKTSKQSYKLKVQSRTPASTSTGSNVVPTLVRVDDQYISSSEYSFDVPPYPEFG